MFGPRVRCSGRAVVGRASLGPAGPGGASRQRDLCQGHRAALAEELPGLPPARRRRPDVPADLRRGPAVGAVDQDEGARRRDAAVPLRPDRHPGPEGRPAAQRGRDADLRPLGGRRCAARQHGRHAAAAAVLRHQQVDLRGSLRSARCDRADQALRPAGAGAGPLVAADRAAHRRARGSLHQGDGGEAVAQGPRRRPSCQQRPDGARREDRRPTSRWSASRNTPRARPARSCRRTAAARCRPTR